MKKVIYLLLGTFIFVSCTLDIGDDNKAPEVSFLSPVNNSLISTTAFDINLSISDDNDSAFTLYFYMGGNTNDRPMILFGYWVAGKTFSITGVDVQEIYPVGHVQEGNRICPIGETCIIKIEAYDYEGASGTAQITVIADI